MKLNQKLLVNMKDLSESLYEDMNEDEYEGPPSLGSNETTTPSTPGSSHWTPAPKDWPLTRRIKEAAQASI
eukprot:12880296-Prorocentrum_lima.AAC.1